LLFATLLAGCTRQASQPVVPPFATCDAAARRDAVFILHSVIEPRHHLTKPPQVVYVVDAPAGTAYLTYLALRGQCSITHLDARWERHDQPLMLTLRGGRLRSVTLRRVGAHAQLVVVDRWGRESTTALTRAFPVGLTLWEETNSDLLHAALATRWQSEAGADIFVGKDGPVLFPSEEQATPPPSEWDVDRHAFVRRVSVYKP
jgi:hypothetical protein